MDDRIVVKDSIAAKCAFHLVLLHRSDDGRRLPHVEEHHTATRLERALLLSLNPYVRKRRRIDRNRIRLLFRLWPNTRVYSYLCSFAYVYGTVPDSRQYPLDIYRFCRLNTPLLENYGD